MKFIFYHVVFSLAVLIIFVQCSDHNTNGHIVDHQVSNISTQVPLLKIVSPICPGNLCKKEDPHIVFRYTGDYNRIWDNSHDATGDYISMWSVNIYQTNFFSLGDVFDKNDEYKRPNVKAIMVAAVKPGVLARPDGFTRIYYYAFGGEYRSVYRMNAPTGYTCIGEVAMGGMRYQMSLPDKNNYVCVKDEYIVPGKTVRLNNDLWDYDANEYISLWRVKREDANLSGIEGGNFLRSKYGSEDINGYLLKEDKIKVINYRNLIFDNEKPLNLHELTNITEIWNSKGNGIYCVSIWRAVQREGYYSIGDIAVKIGDKPLTAFALTLSDPDDYNSLRHPISYEEIWNDKRMAVYKDVTIWKPICRSGYVALGYVATDGHGKHPDEKACYCVKHEYILSGSNSQNNWHKVWADYSMIPKFNKKITIYESVGDSDRQQRSRGFGAIASHNGYPGTPYLLNTEYINYIAEPPIQKVEILDIEYHDQNSNQIITPMYVSDNDAINHSDQKVEVVVSGSYKKRTVKIFTFRQSFTMGVTFSASLSIPFVAKNEYTFSLESTTGIEWGKQNIVEITTSLSGKIPLPPHSKSSVKITYNQYKTDIPFTASVKKFYHDGTEGFGKMAGIFKGVNTYEGKIVFGKIETI